MKADCMVWLSFLNEPQSVCRPFIDMTAYLSTDEIDFYTDASQAVNLGFGCVYKNHWTWGHWEPNFIQDYQLSIEYLELYRVAVGIELWAPLLQNNRVVIFCDNKSVVEMINKNASPCKNCMILIRTIVLTSLRYNVRFFTKYMKSAENILADTLS